MYLEIVHQGSAIHAPNETITLKQLLQPHELQLGERILETATLTQDDQIQLRFADGTTLIRPLHNDEDETRDTTMNTPTLMIHNIGQLLTMEEQDPDSPIGIRTDVALLCAKHRVLDIVPAHRAKEFEHDTKIFTIDARGGVVSPGLIDPHTHPVFAGERFVEFGIKARGASYLEIHHAGGGIFSTVNATRNAIVDILLKRCTSNLTRLLHWGVTTCEGKSGYALNVKGELRLLEVLRAVTDRHPVDLIPTVLAAHAIPLEYKEHRRDYIAQITEQILPMAVSQGLARYCDAFLEEGAFTLDEVRTVFEVAKRLGLGLRLHTEQFSDQRGSELAASLGAATVDHLEHINPDGIRAIAEAKTTAVLLPGAALTCRCPWPPARALYEAGVSVALGTDLNPGSSMTHSLPLMMSLATTQMKMTCEEAWRAVTSVAADSLNRPDLGRVRIGAPADLVIFDVPDYRYVPYHFGENHARIVIKRGSVVVNRN